MVQIGLIFAGFAASTFVAGWASDEASGRLELVLTTPLARWRWAIASGLGVLAAIALMTGSCALAIGAGVALDGNDPTTRCWARSCWACMRLRWLASVSRLVV